MTLNRRQFLGSALPLFACGAETTSATTLSPSLSTTDQKCAIAGSFSVDNQVLFAGDSLPYPIENEAIRLQALLLKHPKLEDSYLKGGAVAELEEKFSSLLGKEASVFMPTGTMANHIAIRLLCGEARHALVQQESHVYRDESNTVSTISGINLVPLASGKAAPSLGEITDAINRAEIGPYPIKVGATALESPVRRAQGGTLTMDLISEIALLARAKHIPMHLDGARLLMMCGMNDFNVKKYCEPFDTVYVSLYKYLGAPYGAVLSGTKPLMEKARELRHIFGGSISSGWQAALPALDALEGVEQRFSEVHLAGQRLLSRLEKTEGFKVQRIEHASNIALLDISPKRLIGLEQRLKQANIKTRKIVDGKLTLQFNETLLRRDTNFLVAALAGTEP